MKQIIKFILFTMGLGGLLGISICMYSIFLYAYFNDYKAAITINDFGEANFELILIPFCIGAGIWSIYFLFKKIKEAERV